MQVKRAVAGGPFLTIPQIVSADAALRWLYLDLVNVLMQHGAGGCVLA